MPYVLLTSFREVKVCMEILAGQAPQNRPVFTVVICDVKGQYTRATRWAASLSEPMYVFHKLTCHHTLVYGMLEPLNYFLMKNTMPTLLSPSLDRNAWQQSEASQISDQRAVSSVQQHEEHDDDDAKIVQMMQACWENCASLLSS